MLSTFACTRLIFFTNCFKNETKKRFKVKFTVFFALHGSQTYWVNMHFYGQADHKKLKYLRQCTDVCIYLFLGANVGQLTDKSMLTAPTHALNVPGRWGKANWRKLDIVGRYCIAQEGGRFCIVAALNSPWQSKIAFGRIVPRYC